MGSCISIYSFTWEKKKKSHSLNLFQTDPSLPLLMSQDAVGQNLWDCRGLLSLRGFTRQDFKILRSTATSLEKIYEAFPWKRVFHLHHIYNLDHKAILLVSPCNVPCPKFVFLLMIFVSLEKFAITDICISQLCKSCVENVSFRYD